MIVLVFPKNEKSILYYKINIWHPYMYEFEPLDNNALLPSSASIHKMVSVSITIYNTFYLTKMLRTME